MAVNSECPVFMIKVTKAPVRFIPIIHGRHKPDASEV